MNVSSFKKISRAKKLGALLIGTTLAWSLGLPLYMGTASAASLTNIRDTIVDSHPGNSTNHVLVYTTINAMVGSTNGTTTIQFAPGNAGGAANEFLLTNFATSTDFAISGSVAVTEVANAQACGAPASEVYNSFVNNVAGSRIIGFAVCPGDTVAAQTLTVTLTGGTGRIINPSTPNSYVVRVAGTQTDSADTRIAIISNVTMTAKVDTTFTFTISGTATSTSANGTSTTFTTTATAIPFNTVAPGVIYTGAQFLNVTTNATNGFGVTVVQNQNLLSSTGADIDLFIDGAATAAPTAWQAPANTLGSPDTYGHYGLTSEDNTLPADTFGTGLYVGDFGAGTPRTVFYHSGPSNGIAQHSGSTTVAYQLQIGSLQEAANDYNNTLTYVATPIF